MTFRRILSLLLALCLIFGLAACGGRSSDEDEDKSSSTRKSGLFSKSDSNDEKDNDDKDVTGVEEKDTDDEDVKDEEEDNVSSEEDEDNPYKDLRTVDLPKGYPKDAFPIYKGGKIYWAGQEERNGADTFTIMAAFEADLDTLQKFYQDAVKNAQELQDQSFGDYIAYTGRLEGYIFSLTLFGDGQHKNYSMITLELTEIPSAKDVLNALAEAELPDGYPVSNFPIIGGGALFSASESENNGKASFELMIYTDMSFKEVVAFYEEKIGDIADKQKSISTGSFNMGGTANGYYFYISGDKAIENNVEFTRYYIRLDPAE